MYNGPLNPNPADGESGIVIYGYVPSLALGAVGVATFALAIVVHGWHLVRIRRTRTFEGLLVFGSVMELIGYIFRIRSHSNPFVVIDFVLQYFFIVCAPIFFAAALYLGLSIVIGSNPANTSLLPVPARSLVPIFVTIDVVTTILQVAGAALIGVAESGRTRGKTPPIASSQANDILLAGLAVQNASFLAFLGILLATLVRSRAVRDRRPPTRALLLLLVTSLLIFLRTLFRLGETAEGIFGFASTHESLFGVFEFAPVGVAVLLLGVLPLGAMVCDVDGGDSESGRGETGKQAI